MIEMYKDGGRNAKKKMTGCMKDTNIALDVLAPNTEMNKPILNPTASSIPAMT
jgi:hypothetical protein